MSGFYSRPGSRVCAAVGALGVALFALFAWGAWKVATSPGDDNPMGMLYLAGAALALVPSRGVVLYARRAPIRRHLLWLAAAAFLDGVLTIVAYATILQFWLR